MKRLLYFAIAILAGVFIVASARAADSSTRAATDRNPGDASGVVAAVREPSTYALMALGSAAVAWTARRRRRA